MPLLREGPALSPRAGWTACLAGGAALAAAGGLLSRWCADPALGWGLVLAASAAGVLAAARTPPPDGDGARAWTAAGALAALALPALLRLLGLGTADGVLLQSPLGGAPRAAFVLGQCAILAAAASFAWTRGARGEIGRAHV